MPTTNYRSNAGELIRDALYLIEALEEGEPITPEQEGQGIRALSRLIASWQSQSEHVWTMTEGIMRLTGAQSYRLGRESSAAYSGGYRGFITAPSQPSPAPSQIQTFTVPATSEFPEGTSVIVTANNPATPVFQTTVASTLGSTITLTDPLPFANEGGVLAYGDNLAPVLRPLRIFKARRADSLDGAQIPLHRVSRETYQEQPSKGASGGPVEFYYDAQLEHGELYVWGTGEGFLFFTYERELLKPTALTDVLDFPEEWFDAIIYNLANRLAPMFAVNPVKRQLIKMEAEQLKGDALAMDSDAPYLEMSA